MLVTRSGFHDGVLYVSDSLLHAVMTCSTLVAVKYALGLSTPQEAAELYSGVSGHEALAEFFKTAGNKTRAMHVFREFYKEWSEQRLQDYERLSYAHVRPIISRWFDEHPLEKLPFKINKKLVEVPFQLPLTKKGDVVIIGRMDLVPQDKDTGSFYVLDHKFTRNVSMWWERKYRNDSQMSCYTYAAEQSLDVDIAGAIINAIELPNPPSLKTAEDICKEHKVQKQECYPFHATFKMNVYSRSQYQLASWRRTAVVAARRFGRILEIIDKDPENIAAMLQEGQFTSACRFCALEDFCVNDRPEEMPNLIRHEWTADQISMMAE